MRAFKGKQMKHLFQSRQFPNLRKKQPSSGNSFFKTGSVSTAIHVYFAFSGSPRLTGTFPVQKRLLQHFRKHFQTYLTLNVTFWISKNLIVIKQTQVHTEEKRGASKLVTQKLPQKMEMPPVTFHGTLYKAHAQLCSKIPVTHAVDVHEVRTWKFFIFGKFSVFLSRITCA